MLITTDQQHFDALGSRTPLLETPNIDRSGVEGVTLDRAYCPNPLCSPPRSSILTGRYPSSHVREGLEVEARGHVLVEDRHQPTKVHIRTYINDQYKITLYPDEAVGELFDLLNDPGETTNRFDDESYADVKAQLLAEFMNAEIARETRRYQRIAAA
ncbi:MAG TPA: sulfatase-like hydrolase/transferase [Pseudolysinimonas sp.]|nr:sulfatase-like hydrolase/transferase [Pseudolysinimonas sp.]